MDRLHRGTASHFTMISVIIPTHNRAFLVKEAVDSVLSQMLPDIEIELIVVDDGSEDNTQAILKSYGASVKYFYQSNAGVSAARNAGIELATGEWLAFLDSDDLWLPGKLQTQLDFLRLEPHIRICQTEELWIKNGVRLNPKDYHKKPSGYCFPALLERCLISPSAVMIHRSLFDEVGLFDETMPACEDYDLWLRIGCRHPVGLVERPLIEKRGGHADQLSTSVSALDKYRIAAIAKLLRTEALDCRQQALALHMLAKKCRIFGAGCLKRGRTEEGERILSLPTLLAREIGLVTEDSNEPW